MTRAEGRATDLAAACADLLGPVAAAVLLHGSLAFGQFAAGRSEIDILVVVDRSLGAAECMGLDAPLCVSAPIATVQSVT